MVNKNAFNVIISSGEYTGLNGAEKCFDDVLTTTSSITVTVTVPSKNIFEFSATQRPNYPSFLEVGTRQLYVKPTNNQVKFTISNILLDHRDEDARTYIKCNISR